MEEEEILNRTVKLLEQGCTMLASHHSCGAPLFRCKGDIICPVCSSGIEDKNLMAEKRASLPEKSAINGIESKAGKLLETGTFPQRDSEQLAAKELESWQSDLPKSIHEALKKAIATRMGELIDDLLKEQDLSRLKCILDCIEAELKVLNLLAQKNRPR